MRRMLWLLLPLLILAGCGKKGDDKLTPLAEVNGEKLYLEMFRATFTDEQWNSLSAEQKKKEIENWINLTLMAQEADEQSLDKEKAVRQRIELAEKKVKANALMAQRMANINIGEEEMFNYYRVHQSEFQSKLQEFEVQRILCPDASAAEILLQRLRDGYDFNLAVREQSQESLKDNLGKMGFVTASGADSLFWRAAHGLWPNQPRIAPIGGKTYILHHTARREGSQDANFGEYRAAIREILLKDRQKQVYDDLVRELRMKAKGVYLY